MSRNPQLKSERNKAIKEAFKKLEAETVNGPKDQKVQKYRREAVLAILSRRFFLAPDTIADIILLPDEDDDESQLILFGENE